MPSKKYPTNNSNVDYRYKQKFLSNTIYFQKDEKELWRMYKYENGLYLESILTGVKYRLVLDNLENTETLNQRIEDLEQKTLELEQRIEALEQLLQ